MNEFFLKRFSSMAVLVGGVLASSSNTAAATMPAELVEPLQACVACHGEDGNGTKRSYPFLNWQSPQYLVDQMIGYQKGTQPTIVPKHIPASITAKQIQGIAEFYGKQKPDREPVTFDAAKAAAGKAIHDKFCNDCHLDNGRKFKKDGPTLAGQPVKYLFDQEKLYASGKRKYTEKADVAHSTLTEADREAVSHFYASQSIKPAASGNKK